MSKFENNFSIYPYGYNELTESRAREERRLFEEKSREQLANELTLPLGALALGALTGGIASPEYKESSIVQPSATQMRKLGARSIGTVMTLDNSFMNSLVAEQSATLTEQAILGYATRLDFDQAA